MIKVIALDIYGTVLATDDADNELPPRRGLEAFFNKCKKKKIEVVVASDALLDSVRIDLKESGVDISQFSRFYQLPEIPKDFSKIIRDYGIKPKELLVIGDRKDKDIKGAIKYGCCWFHVPEYHNVRDDLDLSKIRF